MTLINSYEKFQMALYFVKNEHPCLMYTPCWVMIMTFSNFLLIHWLIQKPKNPRKHKKKLNVSNNEKWINDKFVNFSKIC